MAEIYGEFGWRGNPEMVVVAPVRGTLSGRLYYYSPQSRGSAEDRRGMIDVNRLNQISGEVVDASIQVHTALGPGLLESSYEACLACELRERGLSVRTQVALPLVYKGIRLDQGYRIDILVEESVVVEIKTILGFHPVHEAQLITHLKLSGHRLGLLLNFHVPLMRDGIKRFVNGL
ncbi:MAG TPA: GxxExxY protein [Gemmatimonadaceae bacterium]|nr:GxxExxY protein [Gemmatimonadaceae bacterium]